MIYDVLSNFHNYIAIHPLFSVVSDFINSHDLSAVEIGRTTIAQGVFAVVNEYATDRIENKFIECHKRHIDIQIVLDGIEQVGICNKNECKIIEEYNEEKDLEKLEGKTDLITLKNGCFAIFFPQDGHVPGLIIGDKENRVKKAVFKIPVKKPVTV
jgi:biofilm protein TabA